ncbi:formimidoylglutamase [Ignavigranum ruoffiae]|uniref:Formimidoylglutamase n=1 Tax=Ignavigranum ruoffiae TaxID=89093 RepID=A0A1H9BP37_9LACT|nr:formimidoylglutamase [Ignavigranum ruoffiae]SEP90744.1 formiminoglutamase [Ignavigranum ruoffiae]
MLEDYKRPDVSLYYGKDKADLYQAKWVNVIKPLNLNQAEFETNARVRFALLGFRCDKGVYINHGRAGAIEGPTAIRQRLFKLPWHLGREVQIFDAGDIEGVNRSLSQLQSSLAKAVQKLLDMHIFPIVLGGGHETAFGHYLGLSSHPRYSDKNVGVINIDAHFDLRPYDETGPNSGTGFRQMHDMNHQAGKAFNYLVMGIQEHANQLHLFDFVAKHAGLDFVTSLDIWNRGLNYSYQVIDDFIAKVDHVYLTIDMDVFSMGIAPGVSAFQPLGLNPQKVIPMLQHLAKSGKVIGFDIVELSPPYDYDQHTATLAAMLIFYLSQVLYQVTIDD